MDNIEADKVDELRTKKKRGFWFSTFLILMMIVNSITVYIYITSPEVFVGFSPRATMSVLYLLVFIGCINIVLAMAVWAWKKWAVYGFYASILIVFCINLYLGIGIFGLFPGLIGGLIIFLATKKRWSHFS